MEPFTPKIDKHYFFYQHSQPLYDVLQKKNEIIELIQVVNFELIASLKQRYKVPVNL